MAIYTVGRRRVILALLLTSALLLTLDLRGNAVLDRARDGFSRAMEPVEDATEVVTNPLQRLWESYRDYDDLERENEALREQLERVQGTQAAAEAAVIDYQLLLALNELPSLSGIETEKAQVVGASANNLDQIVEINKGRSAGIAVGMPVVNQAGLIGKVTSVTDNTAKVMLVTDRNYSVAVEILGGTGEDGLGEEPVDTTPSGLPVDELDDLVEPDEAPASTTPLDVFGDDSPLPQATPSTTLPASPGATTTTVAEPLDETADATADGAVDGTPSTTTATTTTTTIPPTALEKEFGSMEGRGPGRLPQVRFLQDNPSLAVLQEGDLVETAGGSDSLAPPNIPVGRVINRANRPGVAGPILEIDLWADLDQLNFVRVVLYRPLSEVES